MHLIVMVFHVKIAIATKGFGGLNAQLASEYGWADTFTIVDIEGRNVRNVEVIVNPASSYDHGRGPIVSYTLINKGVTVIVAARIGPGALEILKKHGVKVFIFESKLLASDALNEVLQLTGSVK